MATLKRAGDGSIHVVPAQCLVGRSASCTLRVDDPYVSSEHAKLVWTGAHWTIRDLGSRNGTFIDGKRLEPGKPVPIHEGAAIGLGEPKAGWSLADAGAPGALVTDQETGRVVAACGELLALPTPEAPEVSIYPDPSGAGWVVDHVAGEVRPIADRAIFTAAGRTWRLELPVMADATPMVDVAMTLENIALRFAVTPDEERVEITVILHGVETRLEPREHGYLLLTLARARLEDARLAAADRGWRDVERLSRMLRLDVNALDVATHRARQQLAATGLEGASGIVQSQRGRRRFGTDRFEIGPLDRARKR